MGRTLPTVIRLLDAENDEWKRFKRALRKEDQEAFDSLWRYARRHAVPVAMASRPIPTEAVFMAALVGIERGLQALKARVASIEDDRT